MKLIIKSKPEDFIVEEIANLSFKSKGEFGIYRLGKKHWNTVGVILEISRKTGIPFKNFSYGGKKDRHALTRQHISIRGPKLGSITAADYSLDFLGFLDRPMGPDLIEANSFKIIVRKLTDEDIKPLREKIELVKKCGYPNYFDDQRFGSFDNEQGFLAEKLLLNHLNGALKIYLTSLKKNETKGEKQRRLSLRENWGNWKFCKTLARSEFEKKAFDYLIKKPGGLPAVLRQIPRERLSIYFAAYQAYIWNEVARRVLKERIAPPFRVYPGFAGDYLFYSSLESDAAINLKDLDIPTIASRIGFSDALTARVYEQVTFERGIKKAMFNRLKVRQVFFKSSLRKLIVRPQNLSFDISRDENEHSRKKLTLEFLLSAGSYATMLLKRLFSR